MARSPNSITQNPLLTVVVRRLESSDISLKTIVNNLNRSTVEQMIPVFSYITHWLDDTQYDDSSEMIKLQQEALHILGLLAPKIPPIVLFARLEEIKCQMAKSNWLVNDIYRPLIKRIKKMRKYVRHTFNENVILSRTPIFYNNDKPQISDSHLLLIEMDSENAQKTALKCFFIYLIINRFPINYFRPHFDNMQSKLLLTEAITDIIYRLNTTRNATHCDLIFSFSVVFLYIQALINDIDGQIICQFLRKQPFLSPFCLLALINHIPPTFYLFNLIMPKELFDIDPNNNDEAANIISKNFPMADLTEDHTLDFVIEKIPEMLQVYFLNKSCESCNFSEDLSDPILITNFHTKGMSIYEKMKGLIHIANSRDISTNIISSLNLQLLNCITRTFQRTFIDCWKSGLFTPALITFFLKILSLVLPTLGEQIINRFLENSSANSTHGEIILAATLSRGLPFVVNHSDHPSMIILTIKHMHNTDHLHFLGLQFITKLLRTVQIILIKDIVDAILVNDDVILMLEYICSIDDLTYINRYDEYQRISDFRSKMVARLPFISDNKAPYTINGVDKIKHPVCNTSMMLLDMLNSIFQNPTPTNLIEQLHASGMNSPFLLRMFTASSLMHRFEMASAAVQFCCEILSASIESPIEFEGFVIKIPSPMITTAQALLSKVIRMGYHMLAENLLRAMRRPLDFDPVPLHWMAEFLPEHLQMMTPAEIEMFRLYVLDIPQSKNFFFEGADKMSKIVHMIETAATSVVIDPSTIDNEFHSVVINAHVFSGLSLTLTGDDSSYIASKLLEPIFDIMHRWGENREAVAQHLAGVAAELTPDIGKKFFIGLMDRPRNELARMAMRYFMIYARLPTYIEIVEEAAALVRGDVHRLKAYMGVITPGILRIAGNDEAATRFLCGLCESVNESTPRKVQEKVIDTIDFIYISLKLAKGRSALINSSKHFLPDLRTLLASSLEIDMSDTHL